MRMENAIKNRVVSFIVVFLSIRILSFTSENMFLDKYVLLDVTLMLIPTGVFVIILLSIVEF